LVEDAISRAYYATLHAAKAALLVHDVIATSHAAVRQLFGQVLVMAEGVECEWAQLLARGYDQRGAAEYNVDFAVDEEAADRLVRDAQRFSIRKYKATFHGATFHGTPAGASQQPARAHPAPPGALPRRTGTPEAHQPCRQPARLGLLRGGACFKRDERCLRGHWPLHQSLYISGRSLTRDQHL
jgi:uncharacterized protein (UPF0332 family)